MFDITLNGKQLYHPNSTDCNITNAVIHEALNDSGYLDLTIPFTNPLWNEIAERKGKIIVYKDNKPLWYGEVRDISVDFSKNKTLYIVGEAAYLNDTVQPQKQYKDITKYDLLETMINIHNSMVEDEKKFYVGTVGSNASVRRTRTTDWEYTLDAIRKHVCDEEEYFRIRHVNNVRYIDIMPLDSYGKHSDQNVMFGENLLDYVEESNGEGIASICIPLGATLDTENVPDTENYLTCESANNGKNYVYLPGAVDRIGKITKVVHFNVLTTPEALVTAGMNWLKEKQYASLALKLSAVDLSVLHSDIDDYSVGDYIHAICEPMGMDAWFPVRERETDLLNLSNNNITVGSAGTKSITSQQAEKIDEIETIMPKKDSILDQAKKNASALLNTAGKDGHVVFRQNDQGVIYEILIMDTPDIDTASKMWRFNENGIGYADSKDSSGQWAFKTAWTMDGHFNADAIICDNLEVGKNVTMGKDAKIKWTQVEDKPSLASTSDLNGLYSGVTTLYYCKKVWYEYSRPSIPDAPTSYVSDNTGYEDRWTTVCPNPNYESYARKNNGVVVGYYYNYYFYQCTQYTKKQNGSVVYSWSTVQEFDNSVSTTVITKNSVTTSFVNALEISAKDISATTLNGKTLNLEDYNSISLYGKDSWGNKKLMGLWDSTAFKMFGKDNFGCLRISSNANSIGIDMNINDGDERLSQGLVYRYNSDDYSYRMELDSNGELYLTGMRYASLFSGGDLRLYAGGDTLFDIGVYGTKVVSRYRGQYDSYVYDYEAVRNSILLDKNGNSIKDEDGNALRVVNGLVCKKNKIN